jgi:hypothetical protein
MSPGLYCHIARGQPDVTSRNEVAFENWKGIRCRRKSDRPWNVEERCSSSHSLLRTVKLSLCLTNEGVWGTGCIYPNFLDLGTRWRLVVSFTPRPLYPWGKSPWYPMDRRLDGTQSLSGRRGEEEDPWNKGATLRVCPCPHSISVNCWLLTFGIWQMNFTYTWSATVKIIIGGVGLSP